MNFGNFRLSISDMSHWPAHPRNLAIVSNTPMHKLSEYLKVCAQNNVSIPVR